jgi:uncharacterized protein
MSSDLSSHRYVLLTTYRKNGEGVGTAVWIAPLDDGTMGFTTGGDSGKVKRLRANPQVAVQPCDVRGRVIPGSVVTAATARVVEGAGATPIARAIRKKYGYQYVLVDLSGRLSALIRRRRVADAAIVITIA